MFNFTNTDRVLINTDPNNKETVTAFNNLTYSGFVSMARKFASHTIAPLSFVINDLLNNALQEVINKRAIIEHHYNYDRSIIFNDSRFITLTHWENKLNHLINENELHK